MDRIEGLILAAGKSSRMYPAYKMILDLGGKPLIQRTIDSLSPFCARIFVVIGYHAEHIREFIPQSDNIVTVFNPEYEFGMLSSLKAGLRKTTADRVLFLPGDCPFVPARVFAKLLDSEGELILPVFDQKPGHPVLFSGFARQKLLDDEEVHSLAEFCARNETIRIDVGDPEILWDIDTSDDLASALIRFESHERR